MKLLLKIAIVVIVARFMVHTPQGANKALDAVNGFTLRDVAVRVDHFFTFVEEAVMGWFS
jgi:hypothetical protein